jgi:hypothetical protein
MIVAKMSSKVAPDGETLVFAITAENVVKLLQGLPICKDLKDFGVPGNVQIVIAYAPTMQDHVKLFESVYGGPLPPGTVMPGTEH